MAARQPVIAKINIVAKNFEETQRFYRLLGFEISEPLTQPPGALHATANSEWLDFAIDNEHLARLYNAGWRGDAPKSAVMLTAYVSSRAEVDQMYAELISAGYQSKQAPYDAFWGARFAVVCDPEGNDVGLESPTNTDKVCFPPAESPA